MNVLCFSRFGFRVFLYYDFESVADIGSFFYYIGMSILIKDTTKEEREEIVRAALEDMDCAGCGSESAGIDYQLYIDGKKELSELNREARCGFVTAHPEEPSKSSCLS